MADEQNVNVNQEAEESLGVQEAKAKMERMMTFVKDSPAFKHIPKDMSEEARKDMLESLFIAFMLFMMIDSIRSPES